MTYSDRAYIIVDEDTPQRRKLGAIVVGIGVALLTNTNIFELLGIPIAYDVIGVVLTGVLLGRGSNYIHDLMSRLQTKDKNLPAGPEISD